MIFSKECTGPYIDFDGMHKLRFPEGTWVLTAEESNEIIKRRFENYEEEFGERDKKFWKSCKELQSKSKVLE